MLWAETAAAADRRRGMDKESLMVRERSMAQPLGQESEEISPVTRRSSRCGVVTGTFPRVGRVEALTHGGLQILARNECGRTTKLFRSSNRGMETGRR